MDQNQIKPILYAYTQHEPAIMIIESCGVEVIRLKQDRTKDPVEDVLAQLRPEARMYYVDVEAQEVPLCGI